MKIYLDCYACFLRQALHAARLTGSTWQQQYAVINSTLNLLKNLRPGVSPPEIARRVHGLVRDEISTADPYREAKAIATKQALALYPRLKSLIDESSDPLGVALRLSIAGNVIDLGVADHYDDLWRTVERVLYQPYAIDHEKALRTEMLKTNQILFLADNAGETVFDRLLIEVLHIPVVYAVKSFPTLNDATAEDAIAVGIDRLARIVANGTDAPGTILSLCSEEFLEIYESASLVIAKGQANYESLSDAGPSVFCLLQVKCPVIAENIGAPVGTIVIRRGQADSGPLRAN